MSKINKKVLLYRIMLHNAKVLKWNGTTAFENCHYEPKDLELKSEHLTILVKENFPKSDPDKILVKIEKGNVMGYTMNHINKVLEDGQVRDTHNFG